MQLVYPCDQDPRCVVSLAEFAEVTTPKEELSPDAVQPTWMCSVVTVVGHQAGGAVQASNHAQSGYDDSHADQNHIQADYQRDGRAERTA
ncbi:hypothetical protein ACFXPA_04545 [Amycolatopsis sp. NPDC059090]|uniref:hypothetical protein n=1 Tax=Amycolatopsis sp. NPDC059090 TaxID=3346723 RepID=UPI00366D9131